MAVLSRSTLASFFLHAALFNQCIGEAFVPVRSNDILDAHVQRRDTPQNATMGNGYWDIVKPVTTMAPLVDQSGIAARAANLFKRACPFTDISGKSGNCANLCCGNGQYGWCCNSIYICGDGVSSSFCKYASIATSTITVTATTNRDVTTTEARSSPGTTILSTSTSTVVVTITRNDLETATEVRTIVVTVDPRKRGLAGIPGPTQAPSLLTPPAEAVKKEYQQPLAVTDVSPNQSIHGRFSKRQEKTTPTVILTRTAYITQIRSVTVTSISLYAVTSTTATTITSTSTAALNAKTTVTSTTTFTSTRGVTPAGGAPNPSSGNGGGGAGTGNANENGTTSNNGGESKGLSTGAKAGIGVGAALGALLLGLLAAFLIRRRRAQRKIETARQVDAAVFAATGGQTPMSSPPMTQKYASHTAQPYPHSTGTMSPPGSELEGSCYPQSWNGSQGYEMAATQSPVMGHAQPVYSPIMQHPQPAQGYGGSPVPGQGGYAMPHYAGQLQPQVHEMYHDSAGHK